MRLSGYEIAVKPCAFVIYKNNFVLGATPDGQVVVDGEFGLLEVKCWEEYKKLIQNIFALFPPFLYSETSC